jgi:hypothetical protein
MKSLRSLVNKTEEPTFKNSADKVKFSAAGVGRLLDMGEALYPHETWSANKLYASSLGYLTVPEFVLQYYDKTAVVRNITHNLGMAMEVGTAVHTYIQSRLMLAGVLHPRAEGNFYKEVRLEDENLRIVSKVDGLIDEGQIAELSSTKLTGEPEPRPLTLSLLEIKVLNEHKYKCTKEWTDISKEYRMQATATQKIGGYDRTIFMIVDRGSLSYRFIVYRAEEHLWELITSLSNEIFTHLRNLTRPEGFKDEWLRGMTWEQWTRFHIERQPKRKWLHVGEIQEELSSNDDFMIC